MRHNAVLCATCPTFRTHPRFTTTQTPPWLTFPSLVQLCMEEPMSHHKTKRGPCCMFQCKVLKKFVGAKFFHGKRKQEVPRPCVATPSQDGCLCQVYRDVERWLHAGALFVESDQWCPPTFPYTSWCIPTKHLAYTSHCFLKHMNIECGWW